MPAILIRHTRVDVPAGVCYGRSDVSLAASWPDDFERTLEALRAACRSGAVPMEHLRIFTSPLSRCSRLAQYLNEQCPCPPPTAEESLVEYNFGDWEMQPWDSFYQTKETQRWFANPVQAACPGGESYPQLRSRVLAAWNRLCQQARSDETPCLVTHAGPIRAILSHVLGIAPMASLSEPFEYGEVRVLSTVSRPQ
jgi:alpha-ribazole phosphatase